MKKINIGNEEKFLQLLNVAYKEFQIAAEDMRGEFMVLRKLELDQADKDIKERVSRGERVMDEDGEYIIEFYFMYSEVEILKIFIDKWVYDFKERYWTNKAVEKMFKDLSAWRLINTKQRLTWIDSDGKDFPKIIRFLLMCDYLINLMFDFLKSVRQTDLDKSNLDA